MITRVYLTQYGGWWSLSPREWWAVCREMVAGRGEYDLSRYRELSGRPACILKASKGSDGAVNAGFWPKPGSGALALRPLGWDRERWEEAWEEIDAAIGPEMEEAA